MTIYRIHPDRMHYQLLTISSDEVIRKLGKQNPFHIDPTPKPYAAIWKSLEVSFYDSTSNKNKTKQPDISVDHGRLFLNKSACDALSTLISADGEILPVLYDGQNGAIFNTLKCAEDFNALDTKRSTKNDWGDLQSLAFVEEKIDTTVLFKCQFEGFTGLFCTDVFKAAVEQAHLNGITFSLDLANIFPPDPSAQKPVKQ
ncbi:imm11 family protein [Cellvibrio sp. OA-2007]|uniref:imm11 family protein n=1 Tax=Cellvibrio sp. OA-2007 TaxID=529823 RepID=UPI0007858740|nr:hypothetical protein [Cellvibrio sp. OA-2007]